MEELALSKVPIHQECGHSNAESATDKSIVFLEYVLDESPPFVHHLFAQEVNFGRRPRFSQIRTVLEPYKIL